MNGSSHDSGSESAAEEVWEVRIALIIHFLPACLPARLPARQAELSNIIINCFFV